MGPDYSQLHAKHLQGRPFVINAMKRRADEPRLRTGACEHLAVQWCRPGQALRFQEATQLQQAWHQLHVLQRLQAVPVHWQDFHHSAVVV